MKNFFKPNSLTRNLTLIYTAAGAVTLIIIISALYALHVFEMSAYQTEEMKNRFRLLEHVIYDQASEWQWARMDKRLKNMSQPDSGIRFMVKSDNPIYAYNPDFPIEKMSKADKDGFGYIKMEGRNFRTMSRLVAANGERPEVLLVLALDTFRYEQNNHLIAASFAGILLAGILSILLLAWRTTGRALKPVKQLSRSAAQINPRNLSERLPDNNLPAELTGLVSRLNEAFDKLEESYIRQKTFNSDVAHELRTPLGNLIGTTEVALSQERSREDLQEVLISNLEEFGRLRSIINNMLFLSRADQGEPAANLKNISLAATVRQAAEFMEVMSEDKGISLIIEGDARVNGEEELLMRATANLLDNAIHYGWTDKPVKIVISQEEKYASVYTLNYGSPILPEQLKHLFDRFYRIERGRSQGESNHGLGLAIVKAIAKMHQGTVFAECENNLIKIGFTIPF